MFWGSDHCCSSIFSASHLYRLWLICEKKAKRDYKTVHTLEANLCLQIWKRKPKGASSRGKMIQNNLKKSAKRFSRLLSVESKLMHVTAWSPWAWEKSNTERPVSKSQTFTTCKKVKHVRISLVRKCFYDGNLQLIHGDWGLLSNPPRLSPIPAHFIFEAKEKHHFFRKTNKNRRWFAFKLPSFPKQWQHV